jgi:PAS domain S-box-containing protein
MNTVDNAGQIDHDQLFNATANGVVVTNSDGTILKVNNNARQIFGFKDHTLIDSSAYISLPLIGKVIKESLISKNNIRGYLVSNENVSVVLNTTLIWKKEKILGVVASFQEAAVFEKIAKKFEFYKLQNRELNAIFESVSDGIWVCDGDGIVLDINEASAKLSEIKKEDVIGKSIYELVDEGMFDESSVIKALEEKQRVTIVQNIKKIQKKVLVTATPVFNEEGDISLVVVNSRDMTLLNTMRVRLEKSLQESEKLKDTLKEINLLELNKKGVIGGSEAFQSILKVALKLSRIEGSNILLLGESGTGKGLLAKFVHKCSNRNNKTFIQINCAAVPENLLEAELFGYERGAFTGANEEGKVGLLELSHNGTLFLDEIGELPLSLQSKLLKYFDDKEVMRIGGVKSRKINCTIIAATNRNLESLVKQKQFRKDLFYRINTFTIKIPALRERTEDIFDLVDYYLPAYNKKFKTKKKISPAALEKLQTYPFPGNVRELKNILKKGVVLSESTYLDNYLINGLPLIRHSRKSLITEGSSSISLRSMMMASEKEILLQALEGNTTTREIAKKLQVDHSTVVRKLKKHNLSTARSNRIETSDPV